MKNNTKEKGESYIRKIEGSSSWYKVESYRIDNVDNSTGDLFFDIKEVESISINEHLGDFSEGEKGVIMVDIVITFKSGGEKSKTLALLPDCYELKGFEGAPLDNLIATRKHLQKILGDL